MVKKTSSLTQAQKEYYMQAAIEEAYKAEKLGEVPIGAVVVLNGKIIGRGHNLRETSKIANAHAEMFAIEMACRKIESWRLENAQLFVTLEPCPMCSGAIMLSRIEEVYYGAMDPKGGTAGSLLNLLEDERFNHWSYVESGIMADECGAMLTSFFRILRERNKLRKKLKKASQND